MVTTYLYTYLGSGYRAGCKCEPYSVRYSCTFRCENGQYGKLHGEVWAGYIDEFFHRLTSTITGKGRFRIVANYARLLIDCSDLNGCIDTGVLEYNYIPGQWVSRDTGQVVRESSVVVVQSERPTIVSLLYGGAGCEITLLDIGNYGIEWDKEVATVQGPSWHLGDDELLRCELAGIDPCDGVSLLQHLYEHYRDTCYRNKLGRPSMTYAGQGSVGYYLQGNKTEIRQTQDPEALSMEINAHFGGRAEAYGYGQYSGECALYDFSSFYPSIACWASVPTKHLFTVHDPSNEVLAEHLKDKYCIAKVTIRNPDGYYPCRDQFRTLWPTAECTTFLHHCELERLASGKFDYTVHLLSAYESGKILARLAENLISVRAACKKQGDLLGERYAQNIARGWLGKIGSKLSCWTDVQNVCPPCDNGEWVSSELGTGVLRHYRVLNGHVQVKREDLVPYNGSIAIGGAITAYGRDLLWRTMQYLGKESVLYAGTDSLIVRVPGLRALADGLGRASHLRGTFRRVLAANSCVVARVGVYTIGDRVAHQGYGDECTGPDSPGGDSDGRTYRSVIDKASKTPFRLFS